MSRTFFTFYLGRELEISNGCMNIRFRSDNSQSHRNIRWCGGNKCGTKRGHRKLYSKERHIDGLANRLWKITAVPVILPGNLCRTLNDGIYDLPAEESHYFSYLPVEHAY